MVKELLIKNLSDTTARRLLQLYNVEAIYYGGVIEQESIYCYLVKFDGCPELTDFSDLRITDETDMFINAIIDLGYGDKLNENSEIHKKILDYIGVDYVNESLYKQ